MKDFKGTKGEWVADPMFMDAVKQYTWSIDDKNESAEGLAIVYSGTDDFSDEFYATAEANARLIASAPELLEVLQDIVEMQERNYGDGMTTHLELIKLSKRAKELIKKITGE